MALDNLLKDHGFKEFQTIDINLITIDPQVRKMCEANTCGSFGKNHMCPPSVEDLETWRSRIQTFRTAMLVTKVYELEDKYDMASMMEGAIDFEKSLRDIKDALEKEQPDLPVMLLGAGPCLYCDQCSYVDDLPCLYPDKSYPSVEACGIDVMSLSKQAGVQYNNGPETVTYFGMILSEH